MTVAMNAAATALEPLTLESAAHYIYDSALSDSSIGTVGLELETHLVDLADVRHRPSWTRLTSALDPGSLQLPASAVTVEPGGQVELSGAPASEITAAVAAMRYDEQRLRLVLAESALGLAHLGADPLRSPHASIHARAIGRWSDTSRPPDVLTRGQR